MDTDTVTTFFALVTLALTLAVAGWVVLWVAARTSAAAAELLDLVTESLRGPGLAFAWLVALGAAVGSLYYSDVADFDPCRLCWYQRAAMYPLAVILGVGAWRRDPAVRFYAYPLAAAGGVVAGYHWLIQQFPSLETGICSVDGASCSGQFFERFGFMTMPWMSVTAFATILVILWAVGRSERTADRRAVRSASA